MENDGDQTQTNLDGQLVQVAELMSGLGLMLNLIGNATWGVGLQVASAALLTAVRIGTSRR